LDAVSTTCGSGWVVDEIAILISTVDPPATAGGTDRLQPWLDKRSVQAPPPTLARQAISTGTVSNHRSRSDQYRHWLEFEFRVIEPAEVQLN
jgi:hypothetical protein